jgi:thiamine pyrophosphokinase
MAAKTYLIVANGLWPEEVVWKPLVQEAVHILACDGAAHQCLEHKIPIDTVIGDMDSISEEVRVKLLQQSRLQFLHQDGQENNDLVKAIIWSVDQGATKIEIFGIEMEFELNFGRYLLGICILFFINSLSFYQ